MYSETCNLELLKVEIVPPSLHDKPVLGEFSPHTVAKNRLDRQADTEREATVNAREAAQERRSDARIRGASKSQNLSEDVSEGIKQREKSLLRTEQHQAIAEEALLQTGPCFHRCHNVDC